ncbi:MAG: TIGR03943 family protein [Synergistaceae bacterium]|jgi:putative membrane protein|nr:TIGR03943 family protein [Synergistaceae bacterium]
MIIRGRSFDSQVFIEMLCCLIFSGLVIYLVTSGRYLNYVTPRMKPYLYFTSAVMLIWTCAGFSRLFIPRNKTRSAHCFALAFPILLLLLPHSSLSTSELSYNFARGSIWGSPLAQVSGGVPSIGSNAPDMTGDEDIEWSEEDFYDEIPSDAGEDDPAFDISIYDDESFEDMDSTLSYDQAYDYEDDAEVVLSGLDTAAKKITVSDGQFYQWLEKLFFDPDPYEGYTIRMTGFVFKDPGFLAPDEFVPARLVMSCCVADLLPFGMICRSKDVARLQADSWVTVEGVIRITEENGYREPQAWVTEIVPAEEIEGYLYPF